MKDARLENLSGPAEIVTLEKSPRAQVNMENVACRGVATFAVFQESGRRLAAPGGTRQRWATVMADAIDLFLVR